ncbi:L,D-transpeptidase [Paenibacillus sp. D51F]
MDSGESVEPDQGGGTGIEELKAYVKSHPGNRLAWFFLGKAYARQGMDAKANYCYLESGSVYEAFENEAHPLTLGSGPLHAMLETWDRDRRRKKGAARILLAVLAAFMLTSVAAAPGVPGVPTQLSQTVSLPEGSKAGEVPPAASAASKAGMKRTIVWVDSDKTGNAAAAAIGALESDDALPSAAAFTLARSGGYYWWRAGAKGVLEASRSDGKGSYAVQTADNKDCACESGLSEAADRRIRDETIIQEQAWSTISGIRQFKRLNGKWPDSAEQLAGDYPHNILPGLPDEAEEHFPEWLLQARQGDAGASASGGAGGAAQPAAGKAAGKEGVLQEAMTATLKIVVDPHSRQLALMSGAVVVRAYPVGVGGGKTPRGSFAISEKVRNPNGSSKGPFGSRGMTLSDTRYAIHGTDEPDSIGTDRSLGCIRMAKADLEELYDLVPLGTEVAIGDGKLAFLQRQGEAESEKGRYKVRPGSREENPDKVYDWL